MMRRVVGALTVIGVLASGGALLATPVDAEPSSARAWTFGSPQRAADRVLPDGFSDTTEHAFGEGNFPTALAWLPDRRMLVTTKEGRLWVFPETERGYGEPVVAVDLSARVCADIERGLVGVAVDPDFETNGFVYLYWTHDAHDECANEGLADAPENRVTQHRLAANGTEVPGSRTVIVDHIVSPKAHHIAGDLEFGTNGFLYISVGDGVCRIPDVDVCGGLDNNSRLRRLPHGKILRVTRAGRPAPTNPYVGDNGARRCTRPVGIPPGRGPCAEIFASGLRNPFRMARRPGTNKFFVNDVGQHLWEEIDRLAKGANYGWNIREGHCARDSTTNCGTTRFVNPIHDYRHDECGAVTGGAFVPAGLWPARFDRAYLFADYTCDTVFRLIKTDNGFRHQPFLAGVRRPVHLRFGPSPLGRSLYYLNFFKREVHRVTYHEENLAPVAGFTFTPDGLDVAFDGSDSYDPDQSGITSWHWDFDDNGSTTTTSPSASHAFSGPGTYDVTLTVTDSPGATSDPVTQTVRVPEHPPNLQVAWPPDDAEFAVGEQVQLTASANDPEDETLPGTAIGWEFRLRHGNHFHPYATRHGARVTIPYPEPEDLTAAADSDLVAIVTATDSSGLTTRDRHALRPSTVRLTFATSPIGGRIRIEGYLRRTTFSVSSWAAHTFRVRAPDQRIDGHRYVFRSWSDGAGREHDIVTPSEPTTYTARYRRPG